MENSTILTHIKIMKERLQKIQKDIKSNDIDQETLRLRFMDLQNDIEFLIFYIEKDKK
ncbi:hypothetical protein [Campylobacter sp. RM12651]|uniref:hypothetical protein n=1 Tax=Campylobacter sp. RM12651 TaxID=1660079 RepID=UPI001EFB5BAB|nr:hypothetical protein [Campylobacter sp. RM12651]ULO03784.1 hypothetical protein AVBRAN_1330 [Campylobacter sp. RM12651]